MLAIYPSGTTEEKMAKEWSCFQAGPAENIVSCMVERQIHSASFFIFMIHIYQIFCLVRESFYTGLS